MSVLFRELWIQWSGRDFKKTLVFLSSCAYSLPGTFEPHVFSTDFL